MARFILLGTFTDQGISKVQDTVKQRAERQGSGQEGRGGDGRGSLAARPVRPHGGRLDDETMTAVALSLAKLGNVKTQTLRAFTADEMDKIVGKMV
jgi:uncharacterized protein with GYD domain